MAMTYDYLVVGAGFFGSVIAERIANDLGASVLVIDQRPHIAGNCYSEFDHQTGIEVHKYGTHIFHTSSAEVWEYISRFTEFNGYTHQVLTTYQDKVYQMPINLKTINAFYNLNLTPVEAREFLQTQIDRDAVKTPENLEQKAISLIGRPLYEAFIKNYTIKQWHTDPKDLPPSIIQRIPVRYNYCDDYFVDCRWQGIPLEGYTRIFDNMLQSPNIDVRLNCDFFDCRHQFEIKERIIYTGPIDRYFDYVHGRLQWRTVHFKRQTAEVEDYQGTAVMNYADPDTPFTRIHEFRHLHPERDYTPNRTVLFYESAGSDPKNPYYPVNSDRNQKIFKKYQELARKDQRVIIGGRLGSYAYYDMDKTILAALKCYKEKIAG